MYQKNAFALTSTGSCVSLQEKKMEKITTAEQREKIFVCL